MGKNMKKKKINYYLDTNAVIELGNLLLKKIIKNNCYISELAVIELLKNITERSYCRKKKID